ncbi:MAG: autotransporter domain-containing protein, partial [Opitutaceae bacterium]|nr:autotransporter domain-containing protein [Opitutaceae bacterium]
PGTVLVLPYKATDGTWVIPNTLVTENPVSVFKPYGGSGGANPVALKMEHSAAGDRILKVDQIQYTDNYTLDISGNAQGRFTLEMAGQGFVRWYIPVPAANTGILGLTNLRPIRVSLGEYATLKYSATTATDVMGVQNWDNATSVWLSLRDETSELLVDSLSIGFAKIDGVAGSQIKIRQGTTLSIGSNDTTSRLDSNISQSGTLSGASLTKTGAGELYLGGTSTYLGNTSVSNGALFINGVVSGSAVVANAGSFLGGDALASGETWNIKSNVTMNTTSYVSAGAKGGAVGELRIEGNFTQVGQATWIIADMAGDGAGGILNDKIVVGGQAVLAGSLAVRPLPGLALHAGRYTILEAAGGVSGQFFSTVIPGFLSIDCAVDYAGAGRVDIVFTQREFSGIAGLDRNALAAASVVDNIVARMGSSATQTELIMVGTLNAVTGLNTMNHALAQITPLADRWWFPTAAAIGGDIEKRLEERATVPLSETGGRFAAFAGVSMLNSDLPKVGLAEGISMHTSRFLGGVDFYMNPSLTLTAFYSNETTKADTDNYGGTGKIKGDSFGAHADWRAGNWRLQGTAFFGTDDYQSSRSIMLTGLGADYTDSRTRGDRLGAGVLASRAIKDVFGGSLLPYAGFQWLSWSADAYTEQKSSHEALPMSVDKQSADSLVAKAGLRFEYSYNIKKYNIQARTFVSAGWQWELGDSDRTISATCDRVNYAVTVDGKESGFDLRAGAEFDARGFTLSFSAGRENGVQGYDNVSYYVGLSRRF